MKRILIDGRFIRVGESISRYTLEILKGILNLDKKNDYTLLVRPQGRPHLSSLKTQNLTVKVLDIPHYSWREQTELLKYLNQEKFDLVHFTQFNHPVRYKGKFVISVHDLTLLGHLYRMNVLKRWGFKRVMKSAVKNSEKIITISETTKKDIIDTYNVDLAKIAVTYLGVDSAYNAQVKSQKSKVESFKEKYGITENYILYTGMWKRHKNLLRMLEAFEKYISGNSNADQSRGSSRIGKPQLVLVGKIDPDEPEVSKRIEQINSRIRYQVSGIRGGNRDTQYAIPDTKSCAIICTGFIDEAELPIAYAGALAYIIPSLSEGFGLPPLEAMSCGTPVLSSNVSAMPEILGDAPLYFDPYNIDDIAKAIKTLVEDKDLQAELSKKGLEQAKRYDWKSTAKKTLSVYRDVLKLNN